MIAITRTRRRVRAFFGAPEARRLLRTLMSCAISYAAARLAALPEGYWALITTLVIVTQPSLTQAVDIARDQIIGAFIGGYLFRSLGVEIGHGLIGSLIVAAFESLVAAKAWADADPYIAAGVYRDVQVQPFRQVLP